VHIIINIIRPSPATRHPPPVTRHPPPVTRHPPPVTRHPSPVNRHPRKSPAGSRLIFHVSVHTMPWVPEDVFFLKILIVGGEALPREKLFSSHPSLISSKHEFQRLQIYVARLGKCSCFEYIFFILVSRDKKHSTGKEGIYCLQEPLIALYWFP